jgi:hypothetical protein
MFNSMDGDIIDAVIAITFFHEISVFFYKTKSSFDSANSSGLAFFNAVIIF